MPNIQVDAAHYGSSYHSPGRYYSYIEQIIQTSHLLPKSVIEIGVGSGFVARELRALGAVVHTVDIDPALGPSCVGSVEALPFADGSCDVVSCCEVLEHLPFDRFVPCLKELARITRSDAIVSVPNSASVLQLDLGRGWSTPHHKRLMFSGSPLRRPQVHVFDGQHYWEIGKRGYPVKRVTQAMHEAGFRVLREYRFHLNPYHHFFLLKKVDG